MSPRGREVSILYLLLCSVDLLANWAVSNLAPKSHQSAGFPELHSVSSVIICVPQEANSKTECSTPDAYEEMTFGLIPVKGAGLNRELGWGLELSFTAGPITASVNPTERSKVRIVRKR